MKRNIGKVDRWIRIVVGFIVVSLVFWGPATAWGWLGLIPLVTGVLGFCPLYVPFKFSTYKEQQKPA
ncbi:MAG TPA: DUF2892 domain-containing protein [Candidatus Kryptonia bacterium]